ncbi:FAD/FMN-containing dehydrogenase [Shimia isoporae]|uniref:FAD/FMN-containing dehydrogenase n=1 Tax=Shimia isoporae TaxID=647720 RepID=A0A4R1NKU7_9RHOB|nr:FAD-binding oxidoreductase [Shimia isoporae]TCL08947.1 FAD/FMN-containing dehydrogenase [Shimia isoporae]
MTLNDATPDFVACLEAQLPEKTIGNASSAYLEEPRGRYFGQGGVLARPRSAEEVSTIVKACNSAHVAVVPYGGGTGLVGAQVMPGDVRPVILSLERMNTIRAVYPLENVLVAEAGCVLAEVQSAAQESDRLFPLSLGAEGSARIGGNLSTNAGGVNVLRYGNARDLCLGLEAVLPNGEIWHGLTRLRKDNTGYDLRNLMVGAEGTLGIITAAALKLYPRPRSIGTAVMVVSNPQSALELLAMSREIAGESVSAFELLHGQGMRFVQETLPDVRLPFTDIPEWSVLVELGMAQAADAALEEIFGAAVEMGLVSDGVIARSDAQRQALWSLREHIPVANKAIGSVASHDISLPLGAVPAFISEAGAKVAQLGPYRINCFGHLGDGNLHYNIFPPKGETREAYDTQRHQVSDLIYELVHGFGGSFSAEHGVGRMKVAALQKYADPARLAAMKSIKAALDPNGIMNPGAVL